MDEKFFTLKKGDLLPENDRVYRLVHVNFRDKKNKKIPAERCFSLSPNDSGFLSVEWENKTTPEQSLARWGATYKFKKEIYKDYKDVEIYALDISFLNSLIDVEKVIYDPIYYSKSEKGRVNNPAHSLIEFSEALANSCPNDPETIMKIRDHAANKKIPVEMDKVDVLVKKLRVKNQN